MSTEYLIWNVVCQPLKFVGVPFFQLSGQGGRTYLPYVKLFRVSVIQTQAGSG